MSLQLPGRTQAFFSNRSAPSIAQGFCPGPGRAIAQGQAELLPGGPVAEQIMRKFAPGTDFTPRLYNQLLEALSPWRDRLTTDAFVPLIYLFVPEWHSQTGTPLETFLTWLRDGLPAGTPPGPLFDAAVYQSRAAAADLPPLRSDESAILHWLSHGQAASIVPTDRFDELYYRTTNPDIDRSPVWGFAHFIQHGVHEGRQPKPLQAFYRSNSPKFRTDNVLPAVYRHWHALDFPDQAPTLADDIPAAYTRRLQELLHSDQLAELFAVAQAADPDVGELSTINEILLPPFHDPLTAVHAEIVRRLPATQYDTVICVPWIRVGGADLVAGLLGRALLRIRPGERVLYLRTDNPHFERANWLPTETDVVDISDVVRSVSTPVAEHLLRLLLRGVSAKRVFNVNSRLCWTTLRSYGTNLAGTLKTYSYLFCWDQTPTGLRVGYPAEFFAATVPTITAFLTDTTYLRDELSAMYRLPSAVRDKILPLATPAQTAVRTPSIARLVLERADPSSQRLVLWAGRLDRQKRFDLVLDIARVMPDVEFRCWGAAMLDAPPDLTTLPPNVIMQGSFNHFDELPLEEAGVWLFTALWEGTPTTLIELATRGVSVVASAVGGVPEVIQPDCGWLLPSGAGVEAYVVALREALNSPKVAMLRAEALQRRVATRYNEQVFDDALGKLLGAEAFS
jgi:glycosyltransferase involved in cell wall biosynthesis